MQSSPYSRQQTIIFLHIPKTAGTTLCRIIGRQYPANSIYHVGPKTKQSFQQFKHLNAIERGRFRLIRGHVAYGIHDLIPSPTTYFTILRSPVERAISYYSWVRRYRRHSLHQFANKEDMTLQRFLESEKSTLTDNFQTRLISGVWNEYPIGEIPAQVLDLAKNNLLRHFDVVGLTERFDETLLLLRDRYQWKNTFYRRRNVFPKRLFVESHNDETLRTIAKYNSLDEELYSFAQGLFTEKINSQGADFSARIRTFQLLNRLIAGPLIWANDGFRRRFAAA